MARGHPEWQWERRGWHLRDRLDSAERDEPGKRSSKRTEMLGLVGEAEGETLACWCRCSGRVARHYVRSPGDVHSTCASLRRSHPHQDGGNQRGWTAGVGKDVET